MPTPIGHALAGVAAGYLVAARPALGTAETGGSERGPGSVGEGSLRRRILAFGLLGMLPDVDFLVGLHSTYTHSLGAILVVGIGAAMLGARPRWPRGIAAGAAYGSHVLLDWLGSDEVAPIGVMAFWPFTEAFFLSERRWFLAVCREYWLGSCWLHNARGVAWELALLVPVTAAVLYLSHRAYRR